ncbi:MAG TPA: adenylate/guanylate cyclase domain-containing protein [Candidatus Udaeobacter sp.]|jgi:serine/threonine-protein kinase|nr:adenylate/guanylate cyclase domain-containing protein [Candidatus Udaeobacter sp.]
MPIETKKEIELEIAHVLFIDIVGYSKLSINEQRAAVDELTQIVRATEQFQRAEAASRLLKIPTGDGMALVFYTSPEAPAQCALEISPLLKEHPRLQLRMGIHSGPVSGVVDVNERANLAGAGINIAQRVMDCGDAGHILLSKRVAEDLEQYDKWRPLLHDLGSCEVKHGVRVSVVNLYDDQFGNAKLPLKFETAQKRRARVRWAEVAIALLVLVAIIAAFVLLPRKPTHSAVAIGEKSIAVLPFENLSSDKENAYFAEGIQDEILTDLAKVADLKVISRTSVMQYRDSAARNLREIGQQLGVAHVLEGSVQRAGNEVRVNTQLINAHTDAHEWAEKYDRPINHVFAIQTEIANAIVQQLQAHLSPSEKAAIAEAPTKDLVAFDLFRRARILDDEVNDPGSGPGLFQGLSLLEEAVRRDPNFYLAYCLMAEIDLDLYWGGFDHTPGRRDHALSALKQAEGINPDAGDVHLQKADYAYHGFRDYETARSELELARKSLPNSSRLYTMIAAIDRRQARWDEAVRNFDRAVELDPRDFTTLSEAGYTYGALHRYPRASQLIQQAAALSPKDPFVRAALAESPFLERADIGPLRTELNKILAEGKEVASHVAGYFIECALAEHDHTAAVKALDLVPADGTIDSRYDMSWPRDWHVGLVAHCFNEETAAKNAFNSARTVAAKTVSEQPEYASAWTILGVIDAGLGRKSEAIAEGKRACELLPLSKDGWDGVGFVSYLALIYSWVGEKGLALDQLEISAKAPNGITYGELKLNPTWNALRGDPRFEQIVASLAPKKP